VITIQGVGEPLLHPDIFEMITFAQAQGLRTRFNTNFTVLDEASAERLVRVGHSEVMVSTESIEPAMYADIRRGGTIDTVLDNIALLTATKRRLGSNSPEINVSAVLLRSTLDQVEHLVSEMKRLGVTKLNFQGLQTEGIPERSRLRNGTRLRDNALSTLSAAEIEAITRRIRALDSRELPVTTHWDLGGRGSENIPKEGIRTCRDLWEAPYIDSGGRVTPCCLLPDASLMNMGDLHDKTFTEIWNGPEYQTLRAQHLNNQAPKVCQGCQSMNWIFDPKTGDFVKHNSDERFDNYFVRPPAP
jgi:radical SAM protein with 4Fe4S-binding SPASM domain